MKRKELGLLGYVAVVAAVVVPLAGVVAQQVKQRYAEGVVRYAARAAERGAREQQRFERRGLKLAQARDAEQAERAEQAE